MNDNFEDIKKTDDNSLKPEDNLLKPFEVAQRLRIPQSTVYYLAKTGKLPAFQIGRSWRFPAAAIENMKNQAVGLSGSEKNTFNILVVDDDILTRILVQDAFENSNCQVSEAESVDEALKLTAKETFDLLLIDLKMPERDGTELIRELAGTYSLSQMIVITGFPDLIQYQGILDIGPVTVFRKPFDIGQLLICAREILGSNFSLDEK